MYQTFSVALTHARDSTHVHVFALLALSHAAAMLTAEELRLA
jgi:hypothetical protein